jgi:FtsP/CotA-like multicopper oxidase with cupredoxin domain
MISRRGLLRAAGGAGAAAMIGVPLAVGVGGATSTGRILPSRLRLPEPFTRPFRTPPVLAPVRRDAAGDHYEITQRAGTAEILPGVATPIWGYDGLFPGPTVISTSGRTMTVRHRNDLPVPVVVHLHGGRTPAASDGFPDDHVHPGDTREYRYPLRQPAATLWYHDHRMDFTGPAVWRGLAGFHLVRDASEHGLPDGDRDLPVMIADRSFDTDGTLLYPSVDPTLLRTPGVTAGYGAGVLGDVLVVNGVAWPVAAVPGARHRLRLLNASNARRYRLSLDPAPRGGKAFVQIGADSGLLGTPAEHDTIDLAPGQRCDVVVDFARYRAGQRVTLRNDFGGGTTERVMRFDVGAAVPDPSHIPDRVVRPFAGPVVATRTLHFRRQGDSWAINGRLFDPAVPIASPRLGTTELWRLTSDFHHPVHVHLGHFEVVSRGLGGPGPFDRGARDTIDLRPAEEVGARVRFDDYPGRYVLHCHNLEHEDMAMMATIQVTP